MLFHSLEPLTKAHGPDMNEDMEVRSKHLH